MDMNLTTKKIKNKFAKYPIMSQEKKGLDATLLVKFFIPGTSMTWLITEADRKSNGDWLLFGLCHVHEWEWGYVLLSELEQITPQKHNVLCAIERDLYPAETVRKQLILDGNEDFVTEYEA